jgi:hypothetical protein
MFFEAPAGIRYDPGSRKQSEFAFEQAARPVQEGQSPKRVGITGLGIHPPQAQ